MILVDTDVLVALVDERDRLHARALRDLGKLKGPFGVTSAVLSEACFLLEPSYLRDRLALLLERLRAEPVEPPGPFWPEVFAWLRAYADHVPDFCDALLIALSARSGSPIWTYDTEFSAVWRLPNGKKVPLAVGARR